MSTQYNQSLRSLPPIWGGGGAGQEMAKLYSFGAKAVLVSYFLRLKGPGHEIEVKFFDNNE
jgi:hypothetical protein